MIDVFLPVLSYLLGSVCSAIVICALLRLPDPRELGSANPGTTNVYRIGGKWPAVLTFIFDFLKGTFPVLLAIELQVSEFIVALTGMFACIGHIFPLYFRFQGGKAVATAIGVVLALQWWLGLILLLIWVTAMKLAKLSSVAAIIAVSSAPILAWWVDSPWILTITLMSLVILLRHTENIKRLISGTELST